MCERFISTFSGTFLICQQLREAMFFQWKCSRTGPVKVWHISLIEQKYLKILYMASYIL